MRLRLLLLAGFVLFATTLQAADGTRVKVVSLDAGAADYLPVLNGPPETAGMESGLVILAPGKSVGEHSTGAHEELLIVLEGRGEMKIVGGKPQPVRATQAVYCPPHTSHDVTNTGTTPLRYVYVVAPAKE